jgi:hypothetical protein
MKDYDRLVVMLVIKGTSAGLVRNNISATLWEFFPPVSFRLPQTRVLYVHIQRPNTRNSYSFSNNNDHLQSRLLEPFSYSGQ